MSLLAIVAVLSFASAALPAMLFLRNLALYRQPESPPRRLMPEPISVLIPARDEEASIEACARSVLANRAVDFELLIFDDHSTDRTSEIARRLQAEDDRVRLLEAPELPAGWSGKQRACQILADHAEHDWLLFLDADVRLSQNALEMALGQMRNAGVDLLSGFPRQVTITRLERWLIPLMYFVLLGFLPIGRMRASRHPAYAAGCGQFFLARRAAYETSGGHAAIRSSLHDGIQLPAAFRRSGFSTDICDITELASCRMYRSSSEVFWGLSKNATEGLARPVLIVPATLFLFCGQAIPIPLAIVAGLMRDVPAFILASGAIFFSYFPRLLAAKRFKQSLSGALAHPLAIVLFLGIQWFALLRRQVGRPATWKGRDYFPASERVQVHISRVS